MNQRNNAGFRVRGVDDHHDRGEKLFDACRTEEQAAQEYVKEYLKDWRGGATDEIRLTLSVWGENSVETAGRSFSARMRNVGSPSFTLELQPND